MSLLRDRAEGTRVSTVELFFDLVYVVAVTQLSAFIRLHPSWLGALQALVLLALVWNAWVYTTWVTNWLDPGRMPTRLMLFAVMGGSLVLTAGITGAFSTKGVWVGIAYAAMQVGRSAYAVLAMRGDPLQRNYQRILIWCCLSGALALVAGFSSPRLRLLLFAAAVCVDVVGAFVQFWAPGLGRTETQEWTIDGGHFAERCQAFLLIALGESVVGIGAGLIEARELDAVAVIGFVAAFVTAVALFLLYFHRWAEIGVDAIIRSADPGRLGRVFHFVHPIAIAGIILLAAGTEVVLESFVSSEIGHLGPATIAWFCAGGAALFVIGLGAYIWLIRGTVAIAHVVVALVLLALCFSGALLSDLALVLVTAALLVVLFLADSTLRFQWRPRALRSSQ